MKSYGCKNSKLRNWKGRSRGFGRERPSLAVLVSVSAIAARASGGQKKTCPPYGGPFHIQVLSVIPNEWNGACAYMSIFPCRLVA
jgi:hypothetical protein